MLSGKKVVLRRITVDDLKPAFEARNDPSVYKWCRQNAPLHWQNHCDWYSWQTSERSVSMFAIETSTGFSGVCGLTDIDQTNSRAEFSLYIAPKKQKTGLAQEALKLLLEYGFNTLGLNRIWGEVFGNNEKAMHIFKKFGFVEEGIRHDFYFRDGQFINALLISVNSAGFYSAISSPERFFDIKKPSRKRSGENEIINFPENKTKEVRPGGNE